VFTVLLLFWIGRVAGETVGLLAVAFYGFYPYLLYQISLNDTGILSAAGGRIAAAYRARDTRNWRWAAALGVCFGLGALTKTLIVLIFPLLALWWWHRIGFRDAARLSVIGGAALLIVLAPWTIRNFRVHDEFVFISTNGGSNLHQGNNSCVADYLARGWDAQWVNCLEKPPEGLSEIGADRWHREQAIRYLRDHPGTGRLFWTKFWVL
jgi:4-amino-4-deoxy-L-arabinose transferase-like glycosyltransferase